MSFNINGPSNIPSIQEAQSMKNNGGGGNLGYFMREDSDETIRFIDNQEDDTFEKSIEIDEEQTLDFFDKLFAFLKKIWQYIINFFIPKVEQTKDKFIKK